MKKLGFLLFATALDAGCCSTIGSGPNGDQPPVADFDAVPTSGPATLNVAFTDRSTGTIDTWTWDFGDGGASSIQNPVHPYTAAGTYLVSLTVSGPRGSDTLSRPGYIVVTEPAIEATPATLSFAAEVGGANPAAQTLSIRNSGTGTLDWTASHGASWLALTPASGTSTGLATDVTVSVDIAGLAAGDYADAIRISDPNAANSPTDVTVTLALTEPVVVPNPVLVGRLATPGSAQDVHVVGNLAFVADGSRGLQIIDVTTPSSPAIVGSLDTLGTAYDVHVEGAYAYVADGNAIAVVDVSSPASPVLAGSLALSGNVLDLHVDGSYAYLAAGFSGGLQIVDVSSPSSPTLAGSLGVSASAFGVYALGGYAYVAAYSGGLVVVDVSTPSSPTEVGRVATAAANSVYVVGSYAYVADDAAGLKVVDVSNPALPRVIGSYDTPSFAYDLVVAGTYAFLADSTSLQIVDVSAPAIPTFTAGPPAGNRAEGVFVAGTYAYVADFGAGLSIFRLY